MFCYKVLCNSVVFSFGIHENFHMFSCLILLHFDQSLLHFLVDHFLRFLGLGHSRCRPLNLGCVVHLCFLVGHQLGLVLVVYCYWLWFFSYFSWTAVVSYKLLCISANITSLEFNVHSPFNSFFNKFSNSLLCLPISMSFTAFMT